MCTHMCLKKLIYMHGSQRRWCPIHSFSVIILTQCCPCPFLEFDLREERERLETDPIF